MNQVVTAERNALRFSIVRTGGSVELLFALMQRASKVPLAINMFCWLIVGIFLSLTACGASDTITWQEEVKLSDGRVIVVTQKKRCEGAYTGGNYASCIAREAWLTINLPEFSSQPMVWHESLDPQIVNIDSGRLYVVGVPPTEREYRLYGDPEPFYIGFVWENSQWKKIPFKNIPAAIYDVNMLIKSIPPTGTTLLTLEKKGSAELNGSRDYIATPELRRIDPNYKSNFPPIYKARPAQ